MFGSELTACLQSFKSSHFVWPPKTSPNQRSRSWDFSKPGYLDLFSGCRGVAKVVSKTADTWALCIDTAQDPQLNLHDAELREKLELLITGGLFFAVGAAPLCGSFSIALLRQFVMQLFLKGSPASATTCRRRLISEICFPMVGSHCGLVLALSACLLDRESG